MIRCQCVETLSDGFSAVWMDPIHHELPNKLLGSLCPEKTISNRVQIREVTGCLYQNWFGRGFSQVAQPRLAFAPGPAATYFLILRSFFPTRACHKSEQEQH